MSVRVRTELNGRGSPAKPKLWSLGSCANTFTRLKGHLAALRDFSDKCAMYQHFAGEFYDRMVNVDPCSLNRELELSVADIETEWNELLAQHNEAATALCAFINMLGPLRFKDARDVEGAQSRADLLEYQSYLQRTRQLEARCAEALRSCDAAVKAVNSQMKGFRRALKAYIPAHELNSRMDAKKKRKGAKRSCGCDSHKVADHKEWMLCGSSQPERQGSVQAGSKNLRELEPQEGVPKSKFLTELVTRNGSAAVAAQLGQKAAEDVLLDRGRQSGRGGSGRGSGGGGGGDAGFQDDYYEREGGNAENNGYTVASAPSAPLVVGPSTPASGRVVEVPSSPLEAQESIGRMEELAREVAELEQRRALNASLVGDDENDDSDGDDDSSGRGGQNIRWANGVEDFLPRESEESNGSGSGGPDGLSGIESGPVSPAAGTAGLGSRQPRDLEPDRLGALERRLVWGTSEAERQEAAAAAAAAAAEEEAARQRGNVIADADYEGYLSRPSAYRGNGGSRGPGGGGGGGGGTDGSSGGRADPYADDVAYYAKLGAYRAHNRDRLDGARPRDGRTRTQGLYDRYDYGWEGETRVAPHDNGGPELYAVRDRYFAEQYDNYPNGNEYFGNYPRAPRSAPRGTHTGVVEPLELEEFREDVEPYVAPDLSYYEDYSNSYNRRPDMNWQDSFIRVSIPSTSLVPATFQRRRSRTPRKEPVSSSYGIQSEFAQGVRHPSDYYSTALANELNLRAASVPQDQEGHAMIEQLNRVRYRLQKVHGTRGPTVPGLREFEAPYPNY